MATYTYCALFSQTDNACGSPWSSKKMYKWMRNKERKHACEKVEKRKTQAGQRHKRTLSLLIQNNWIASFFFACVFFFGRSKRERDIRANCHFHCSWSADGQNSKKEPYPSYHKFVYIIFDTSVSKFWSFSTWSLPAFGLYIYSAM